MDLAKSPPQHWTDNVKSVTYPHLSKFLILLLPIMHTTSEVERLFSLVSVTKTKRRGKMKTQTLEALMTIKKNLPRVQDLCTDYPEILSKLVVNRLARDNKRVESLQQQQHAENISEIEADSEASSSGHESMICLEESEPELSDNEMHDNHQM